MQACVHFCASLLGSLCYPAIWSSGNPTLLPYSPYCPYRPYSPYSPYSP